MKPWQHTYQTEQTALAIPDEPVSCSPELRACGAMAPDSGLRICRYPFRSDRLDHESVCQRLYGHPGGHSKKPTTCNRPAGHEGPHTFIVHRDAQRLGEW